MTKDEDGNDKEERFENTPAHEYKYHPDKHEPVVEIMWNVVETAFYVCSGYLEDDISDRDRLYVFLRDYLFSHRYVQERW